ncbi:MAG TPA: molybdenum cofactor biosynthesis protein MoaE [Chloroflexia bacterium]|nr:molybdenum cofactor biosynthesis protein MoaE [Chloroflexia bacterium]
MMISTEQHDRGGAGASPIIGEHCLFEVTPEPLSVDSLVQVVLTGGDGAVVTFIGSVRDNTEGRPVLALEYEAYGEMAEAEMARIGAEMLEKWGLHGIAMRHRVGKLAVGEISVVIAASAPHRAEAFSACSEALDLLKERVPVWKKEYFEDGEVWVGQGAG